MKDTLTKLLDEIQTYGLYETDFTSHFRYNDAVADHLLASEQVMVLPCKPGTKIYHIDLESPENEAQCYECEKSGSGFGDFYCDEGFIGWPSMETKLVCPGDVCPKFKPVVREETFTLYFWASKNEWFNKTWFLTESEANKALEEFNNET